MRTHSLLLSLSLLASCASAPAPVAEASDTEPLPGLSPVSGPWLEAGKYMPAPESISRFLLSLPTHDVLASPALRQRYLQGKVVVQEVPGQRGSRDYLVADRDESSYGFWIRSFHGARPELTAYLVEVRGRQYRAGLCRLIQGNARTVRLDGCQWCLRSRREPGPPAGLPLGGRVRPGTTINILGPLHILWRPPGPWRFHSLEWGTIRAQGHRAACAVAVWTGRPA
jgi:hypothetical protein